MKAFKENILNFIQTKNLLKTALLSPVYMEFPVDFGIAAELTALPEAEDEADRATLLPEDTPASTSPTATTGGGCDGAPRSAEGAPPPPVLAETFLI